MKCLVTRLHDLIRDVSSTSVTLADLENGLPAGGRERAVTFVRADSQLEIKVFILTLLLTLLSVFSGETKVRKRKGSGMRISLLTDNDHI